MYYGMQIHSAIQPTILPSYHLVLRLWSLLDTSRTEQGARKQEFAVQFSAILIKITSVRNKIIISFLIAGSY